MVKKTIPASDKLTLVIAEKPSVAADLVRAISVGGKFKKEKSHYENGAYIVSWALGHLVTLCDPKEISDKYKNWTMETLPILPETFELKAIPTSKSQLTALGKLIRRKDVGTIVNACDAGREGELIFHYILEFEKGKTGLKDKVLLRLWMQSMTLASIREAFEHLRTREEMQNLLDAALSRSEADWLVGINGSRGLTAYNSRFGGFQLTPCGRVQTPTLAMIVNREEERNAFVPKPYWTIRGTFESGNSEYSGKWFDPGQKSDRDRIPAEAQAKEIVKKCQGKTGTVSETTKPGIQKCGPLYDLTTLQREANNRFGFSAKTTLSIAQALYERHKLTSYPRTDSRALPEDYVGTVKKTLAAMEGNLARFAEKALENGWVRKDPRIFNNAKISDHFAIIPTGNKIKSLTEAEMKIYTMICQRFIAVFYPPAEYLNTTRITEIEGEKFITEGKILKIPGFKEVYGKTSDDEANIAPIESEKATAREFEISAEMTNPPPRYTESSLLSMMENAGKLVKDDELADAMKDRGMGTPATRAAIIEKLISDKYMIREGKELIPTSKAFGLIHIARAMKIENLTSPELTGEWEYQLSQIEKGKETRAAFMKGIEDLTTKMVNNIRNFKEEDTRKEADFSPVNGKKVFESVSRYETGDGIQIRKILGGRKMTGEEIVELLTKGKIGPLTGFRSKRGMEFSAGLVLEKGKIKFVFDNGEDSGETELGEQLGVSPLDQSPVFDTLTAYVSKSYIDKEKTGFHLNKVILGKEISIDNLKKLLAGEKTELIQGFRSAKTHRLFDAYLLLDKSSGKIKFDFPPRIPGKGRKFVKKG